MQNVLLTKSVKWVITFVLGKHYDEIGTIWNAIGRTIDNEHLMNLICLVTTAVSIIVCFT